MVEEEEVMETVVEAGEELAETESAEESTEVTASLDEESTEATAETTTDGDRPRNPDGTFAPRKQEDGPPSATVAPSEPPATPPNVEPRPFTFQSDKMEYSLDGAQYKEGEGVFIPESQLQRTKQLLSNAVYFEKNWKRQEQDWKRQLEQAKAPSPELKEKEDRANALLQELDAVLSSQEALSQFYENLQSQGPALKERAKARMLEQKLAEIENAKKSEQSIVEEQQEQEEKVEAFRETVAELKADPRFKLFTEQDWEDYEQEMAELEGVLFVKLEDGPEGPGTYIDTAKMVKMAERRAAILGRVTQQSTSIQKAMDFNKFRAKPKTSTPTAQVPQKEVVATTEQKKPGNRDEWLRSLGVAY